MSRFTLTVRSRFSIGLVATIRLKLESEPIATTAAMATNKKMKKPARVARSSAGIRFAVYRSPPWRNGRIHVLMTQRPAQANRYGFCA